MSFIHSYQDFKGEYLLLVSLEDSHIGSPEYRHITASVIRRVVPHVMAEGFNNPVKEWRDDFPGRAEGYRYAAYVFPTRGRPIYVDAMNLRGQIDTGAYSKPLNAGRPYACKVRFKPYEVNWNIARATNDFFKRQDAFVDKHKLSSTEDNFYAALHHLAQFLGITTVAFYKPEAHSRSLAEPSNFLETDIAFANEAIDNLIGKWYTDKQLGQPNS